MPIVEPEILLDGEHGIDRTFEVAQKVWAEVFFYLAENNVLFEGILLKPSMVTPGAECKEKATPQQVAEYTLSLLKRRIPPAVPGIMASHENRAQNHNKKPNFLVFDSLNLLFCVVFLLWNSFYQVGNQR